jgi:hypothetical protein
MAAPYITITHKKLDSGAKSAQSWRRSAVKSMGVGVLAMSFYVSNILVD